MQNSKIIQDALEEFNTDKYDCTVTSNDDILFFRWDVPRLKNYKFKSYEFSVLKKYYYVVIFFDNGTYIVKDVLIDNYQKNYKEAVLSKLSSKEDDRRLEEREVMSDIISLRKPVDSFLSKHGYKNITQIRNKPANILVGSKAVLSEEADFSDKVVRIPIWLFAIICVVMTVFGITLFRMIG